MMITDTSDPIAAQGAYVAERDQLQRIVSHSAPGAIQEAQEACHAAI